MFILSVYDKEKEEWSIIKQISDDNYEIEEDISLLSLDHGTLIKFNNKNCHFISSFHQVITLNGNKRLLTGCYQFSSQDPNCYEEYLLPIEHNIRTQKKKNNNSRYDCLIIKHDNGFYEYKGWPKSVPFLACMKEFPSNYLKEFCYQNNLKKFKNSDDEEYFNSFFDKETIICIIVQYLETEYNKDLRYYYIDLIDDELLFVSEKLIDFLPEGCNIKPALRNDIYNPIE